LLAQHSGEGNFTVTAVSNGGVAEELLINTTGIYSGAVLLTNGTDYILEVAADDFWTITIEAIPRSDEPIDSLQGSGDFVSDLFEPQRTDAVPYIFTHDGQGNFAVILRCAGEAELVQNASGVTDNQATVRFGEGPCLWQVNADGNWGIQPS
jgi:hypothetical protein